MGLFKRNKKTNDEKIMSFSKKWVQIILSFSMLWITLSYVLAFLDKSAIAENLSAQVVKIIVPTVLGYLCKSFFETFCEKHNELKEKGLTSSLQVETPEDDGFFEEVHREIEEDEETYDSCEEDGNNDEDYNE